MHAQIGQSNNTNSSHVQTRALHVYFGAQLVGVLSDVGAQWRFDYDQHWLADSSGFDLSPGLQRAQKSIVDGGSMRPVQWFFDNLLPEEMARALLASAAKIDQADAFALLSFYGAESAGALTLIRPSTQPGAPTDELRIESGIQPLSDAELSQRIRGLPNQALSTYAPKRMSMAGAQHKLLAVLQGDQLFEPIGVTPSTVLLKPDHVQQDLYPHSAANEWFCMTLARAVGLSVPDVFLRYVPEAVYGVMRFDRVPDRKQANQSQVPRRLHTLDACQLLSIDRLYKYQQASVATLAKLVLQCREKARTRIALLRWSVFNALIGNGDAHLKNLSFFVGAGGVVLTPHYDLLSTTSYARPGQWGDAELSTAMAEASHFGDLRRQHIIEFAGALGVPKKLANEQLDMLLAAITPAAARLTGEMETGQSAIRYAGEHRQIRVIVSGILKEMSLQLR